MKYFGIITLLIVVTFTAAKTNAQVSVTPKVVVNDSTYTYTYQLNHNPDELIETFSLEINSPTEVDARSPIGWEADQYNGIHGLDMTWSNFSENSTFLEAHPLEGFSIISKQSPTEVKYIVTTSTHKSYTGTTQGPHFTQSNVHLALLNRENVVIRSSSDTIVTLKAILSNIGDKPVHVDNITFTDLPAGLEVLTSVNNLTMFTKDIIYPLRWVPDKGFLPLVDIKVPANTPLGIWEGSIMVFGTATTNTSGPLMSAPSRFSIKVREKPLPGDLNDDGKLSVQDAILSLQVAVGLLKPTDAQQLSGDMNADGKLNLSDTTLILREAIGL